MRRDTRILVLRLSPGLGRKQGWWLWADKLDNDIGGIWELEFFDNPWFEIVYTGGSEELEFLNKPCFEWVYELDNDIGGIRELEFFNNLLFELL